MKVIGIIAEYNPFHNGHAYQLEKIRRLTGADYIVVAMSGDYVQRGTPAIVDKYTRAKMALSCGVDLVLELPVLWATASAESFAMAGVTLFEKMGCVDGLCFGAETDDLPLLSLLADILTTEPAFYRESLSSYLKEGLTFPQARAKALCDYLAHSTDMYASEEISSILNEPNNILAIEYLKALKRRHSALTPYLIKREGAGYHDSAISARASAPGSTAVPSASATAIRKLLLSAGAKSADACSLSMPESAYQLLSDYMLQSPVLCADDFSQIVSYRLLTASCASLADVCDCNTDIANRLYRNRQSFSTYERFIEQTKSRDVTYTRISRILLHLLLGLDRSKESVGKNCDYIPYLRILGFYKPSGTQSPSVSGNSAPLLTALKGTACVPLVTKLANAPNLLSAPALSMLKDDIFAADLYEQIKFQKQQQNPKTYSETAAAFNEYTRGLVLL